MSLVLIFGSMSALANASYLDNKNYDDVDKPIFTIDQYAEMALDEVDRMLAEEQLVVDVYVGTLNLSSIDTAIAGVKSLWNDANALVMSLLGTSGQKLKLDSLLQINRGSEGDLNCIRYVFNFLADNAWIPSEYFGDLDLGLVNGFIGDYIGLNIRELAIGMIYESTDLWEGDKGTKSTGGAYDFTNYETDDSLDYDYMDEKWIPEKYNTSNGVITIVNDLVEKLLFGKWMKLNDIFDDPEYNYTFSQYDFGEPGMKYEPDKYDYYGFVETEHHNPTVSLAGATRVAKGAAAPEKKNDYLNFTNPKTVYEVLDALLVRAYNYFLVPFLNSDVIRSLREECGVVYLDSKADRTIYSQSANADILNPDYVEGYMGEEFDLETLQANYSFAKIFNLSNDLEARLVNVNSSTFTSTGNIIDNLNNIFGDIITGGNKVSVTNGVPLLASTATVDVNGVDKEFGWEWNYGGNENLLPNVISVAKFVLACTGREFFGSNVEVFDADELYALENDEFIAYLLRSIFNSSIDWCFVDDSYDTPLRVVYRMVEQMAWQSVPQLSYTEPTLGADVAAYNSAMIEKILSILMDIGVYALNRELDTAYGTVSSGYDPVTNNGLLQYSGKNAQDASSVESDYSSTVVVLATWAISTYGSALTVDFNCDTNFKTAGVTVNDFWEDLDSLINAIIPIKSGSKNGVRDDRAWLNANIAKGDEDGLVMKGIIWNNILGTVIDLDATKLLAILGKNTAGALNFSTLENMLCDLIHRVLDLIFNDVFPEINVLDDFATETSVNTLLTNLLLNFSTNATASYGSTTVNARGEALIQLALPIVCSVRDLDENQNFKELESYLPSSISADEDGEYSYKLYNACSGVATSYRDPTTYERKYDNLYTYEIDANGVLCENVSSVSGSPTIADCNGSLAKGKFKTVTLKNLAEGMIVKVTVPYYVLDETGTKRIQKDGKDYKFYNITYTYVGSQSQSDDDYLVSQSNSGYKVKYNQAVYLNDGESLSDLDDFSIRVTDAENGAAVTAQIASVSFSNGIAITAKNDGSEKAASASFSGDGSTAILYPFKMPEVNGEDQYKRTKYTYAKDENKQQIYVDIDGKVNSNENLNVFKKIESTEAGINNGQYVATVTLTVGSTAFSIPVYVNLYNDYGLASTTKSYIEKNYNQDEVKDGGASYYNAYSQAIKAAAGYALKPRTYQTFTTDVANAKTLYYNLVSAYNNLQQWRDGADAKKIWDKISSLTGYDYTLNDKASTQAYYTKGESYEYDSMTDNTFNYAYYGPEDYVPHTYDAYRKVKKSAESIMNSGICIFDEKTEEEIAELSSSQQQKYYESLQKAIDYEPGLISNADYAYYLHKLDLTYNRMIPVQANLSKLDAAIAMCTIPANASYTKTTLDAYNRALAFANKLKAIGVDATTGSAYTVKPTMVLEATNQLIDAYKHLANAADYTKLSAAYAEFSEWYTEDEVIPEVYGTILAQAKDEDIPSSLKNVTLAYINAVKNCQTLLATKDSADTQLSTSEQSKLDAAAIEIESACSAFVDALEAYIEGGGEEEGDPYTINEEYVGYTGISAFEYTPYLDEELALTVDFQPMFPSTCDYAGQAIEKVLYGLPIDFDDSVLSEIILVNEDAGYELVTIPGVLNADGDESYGSGTVAVILDADGEMVDAMLCVVFGDISGDASIDSYDGMLITDNEMTMEFMDSGDYYWRILAGDISNDGATDSFDGMIATDSEMGACEIGQNPKGYYDDPNDIDSFIG